jgi:hypothetical protein
MARDLDMLLRAARAAEGPSDAERELVRRGLEQRLARGASDVAGLARGTSSGLASGVVLAGALALVVLVAGVVLATRGPAPSRVSPPTGVLPPWAVVVAPEALVASEERPVRVVVATPDAASSSPVVRGAARHAAPPTPGASLAAESRALGDVQRALRDGAGERALHLLDDQDRRFVRGALSEERAAARVLALCAAGRVAAARQGAAAFVARHASSPLRARVLAACGEAATGAVAPGAVGREP